jgi:hypothetical protein
MRDILLGIEIGLHLGRVLLAIYEEIVKERK